MKIEVLKSKIHNATVTEANVNYIGSVTIDEKLMEAVNIVAGEKVQVLNANNGERLETYVIKGKRNSGQIEINGPAAKKVSKCHTIIIISYATMSLKKAKIFKPSIIFPNKKNTLV